MDLVALSNGLHGSVQMDSVALFSWIGWLRHHGILNSVDSSIENHVWKQDGTTYLDDVAVDILDQHRKENPVVIINKDTDSRLKQLEDENKNLLIKVAQQADKISQLNEDLKNKIE